MYIKINSRQVRKDRKGRKVVVRRLELVVFNRKITNKKLFFPLRPRTEGSMRSSRSLREIY